MRLPGDVVALDVVAVAVGERVAVEPELIQLVGMPAELTLRVGVDVPADGRGGLVA